jgi:hypothetical protein
VTSWPARRTGETAWILERLETWRSCRCDANLARANLAQTAAEAAEKEMKEWQLRLQIRGAGGRWPC